MDMVWYNNMIMVVVVGIWIKMPVIVVDWWLRLQCVVMIGGFGQ